MQYTTAIMPWFCHKSSHKRSKTKVGSVVASKEDSNVSSSRASFAVVLQDFEASISDELSIQRGILVETLYTDGSWQYVRDMDGQCGYIPNSFCYNLAQMKSRQMDFREGSRSLVPKPRPKTIHVSELSQPASQDVGAGYSQNRPLDTTTPSQVESCQTTTLDRLSGTVRMLEPDAVEQQDGEGRGQDSEGRGQDCETRGQEGEGRGQEGERSSGNGCVSTEQANGASQTLHSVSECPASVHSITVQTRAETSVTACSTHSEPKPKRHPKRPPLRRAFSYQEAVITADENLYGLTAGIKPSDIESTPSKTQEEARGGNHYDTLESIRSGVSHVTEYDLTDDVFLPETKKPLGIYQCLDGYSPKFGGEIRLQRNELVIMLELGHGEWAWVLTSANIEGLIPKHLLAKYQPGMNVSACASSQASISTQTELIVTAPVLKHITPSPNTSVCNASVRSLASRPSPRKRHMGVGEVREDAEPRREPITSAAVQPESQRLSPPEWFNTTDSRDQTPQPLNTSTPKVQKRATDNSACVQSVQSLAQSSSKLSSSSRLCLDPPMQEHRRAVRAINFEVENDTISTLSTRRRLHQTPVLSAICDYIPPGTAKNCLSLAKGDILYIQPHMQYPKGWMWVWHSTQKTFGYVPKNTVGFMYLVQRKPKRRTDTLEDAV